MVMTSSKAVFARRRSELKLKLLDEDFREREKSERERRRGWKYQLNTCEEVSIRTISTIDNLRRGEISGINVFLQLLDTS
ncbi:hypothetical protein TNCV_604871 [Trichonephila clavipes]|nr:hypothetical protein TNCV_604871 [Trichonephila clavipes]